LVMPGYLKHFTIAYYLQALAPQAMPSENTLSPLQTVAPDVPSTAEGLFWLSFAIVTALILSMRGVEHREYLLEQ